MGTGLTGLTTWTLWVRLGRRRSSVARKSGACTGPFASCLGCGTSLGWRGVEVGRVVRQRPAL